MFEERSTHSKSCKDSVVVQFILAPLDKFFQEFVGRAIDLNLFSRFVERLRFRPLTYRCVLHDAFHHRIGHLAASAPIAAEPPAVTCGGAFGNLQKVGGKLLSFVASAASARCEARNLLLEPRISTSLLHFRRP